MIEFTEEESAHLGPALAAFEKIAKEWPPDRLANMSDEERAEFESLCAERDRLWASLPDSVTQKILDELAKPLLM